MKCMIVLLVMLFRVVSGQIAWTPIYVDGSSQVDLWTQSATGCTCPGGASEDCACCVREGACPCGEIAPTRCAQCGLEQHCGNMCNITIDSRVLKARSGKTFGQIKSPSIVGPGMCTYLLQPDTGQRVEIQVYRLVATGRFNGTNCVGGYLQLLDGAGATRTDDTRLCGINERYTPPVVLFADHGASTLEFHITETTSRSQFLAYFSFTSLSNTQGVGFHPKGGSRIPNTDCDWLYQDVSCRTPGSCVLASPGYPGLYPPFRKCRYLLTTSSVHTRIKIIFTSILFPDNHCTSDYISLRAGSTPTSPLLASLCSERKAVLEHPGPNLLLEFNSGPQVPPFNYNGFIARLEFSDSVDSSSPLPSRQPEVHHVAALMDSTSPITGSGGRWACGSRVFGDKELETHRSGHFDTRLSAWRTTCTITFIGKSTDVVHVSLFNYNLRSHACRSSIEIYEGFWDASLESEISPILKICGPSSREAREPAGTFTPRRAIISKTANVTLVVKRSAANMNPDEDFLDGAFMFHDEHRSGTASPAEACGVTYYGIAAPEHGIISAPTHHHLFWNHEGRLVCSHWFIPATNQSVTVEVEALHRLRTTELNTIPENEDNLDLPPGPACSTLCGDLGCLCIPQGELKDHDHIALVAEDGKMLSCLCGDFKPEWLPVSVRSWTPIRLEYSVAHYTYTSRGFDFGASYTFNEDPDCGQKIFSTHSGEISSKSFPMSEQVNAFFHQQCTWVLNSNVDRQLYLEITTNQDRKCSSWNVTIHEYLSRPKEEAEVKQDSVPAGSKLSRHAGTLLHTFCPRDKLSSYELPWRLNAIVIRVSGMSRQRPEYLIKWKSQVVRANTRLGPPTPAPAASEAATNNNASRTITFFISILVIIILNESLIGPAFEAFLLTKEVLFVFIVRDVFMKFSLFVAHLILSIWGALSIVVGRSFPVFRDNNGCFYELCFYLNLRNKPLYFRDEISRSTVGTRLLKTCYICSNFNVFWFNRAC